MDTYLFKSVGIVVNDINAPSDHHKIKEKASIIAVNQAYEEGLLNIDHCEFLDIVFFFHQSDNTRLSGKIHSGSERGVFASRSPYRPNLIGVTTVRLIKRIGRDLIVKGLDAINKTPVLDIKCCDTSLFASETDQNEVHNALLKNDPRMEIRNNIMNEQTDIMLLKAGQLHGHFCPGLAMGVMAAAFAMKELKAKSDGMEELLAVTETNNCFSDGVQFVTGCSFGNNALIFRDTGKTAFTLAKRDGKGIRICSRHESQNIIQEAFPAFQKYYRKVITEQNHDPQLMSEYKKIALDRAFGILTLPFEKLFSVNYVNISVPDYAPVHESIVCEGCGESVMASRIVKKKNRSLCSD
ncbi:MAG: TrmO family methyltransferase, partial [Bacteroidales bacterium]